MRTKLFLSLFFISTLAFSAGRIQDADVSSTAAISVSKLAPQTASSALVTNSSGVIVPSSVSSTQIGYLVNLSGDIQASLNSKQASLGFTPLNPANNLSDVANAATSRTNLGLGTAATQASTAFDAAGAAAAAQAASDPSGSAATVQAASLQKSSNLSDLSSASTARTNLGLGTAATQASSAFLQPANNLSDVASPSTALSNLGGQPTGNYLTALTGNVVASGPGSATATIQPGVVTNGMHANMAAGTIKANLTGSSAAPTDSTLASVLAALSPFVGDTGSSGTQGLVPAPPAGSRAQDQFLAASGSFAYVDQSKPNYSNFSLLSQTSNPTATAKLNNVLTYTATNGRQYAVTAGTASSTFAIYDVSNQNAPVGPIYNATSGFLGAYNIAYAQISGADYLLVPSSGGYNLYIVNVTNPYSPTVTTTFNLTSSSGSLYNVAYANGYAYLATQSSGLRVVDIGGGGCSGTLTAPQVCYTQGSAKSFGVAVSGNYLYTTQYSTSPYATRLINSWALTGAGTAAVPSLLQSLTLPGLGETLGVSVSGNTAYVSNTTGVQQVDVVDITTPSSMSNLVQFAIPSGYSIAAAMKPIPVGNYLFMPAGSNATYGGSVFMYDISNIVNRVSPYTQYLMSTVTTNVASSSFGGISILNGYLYAGDYGPAPGSAGNLDTFSLPQINAVVGGLTADNITVPNFTTAGVLHNSSAGALSSSLVANADMVNSSTTINGTLCTLGSTCTVAATGAVTAVSVATANGFQGSSSGGNTPALTLQTSVSGMLKGSGNSIVQATSNSDYLPATSGTAIQKANGSGGLSSAADTDVTAETLTGYSSMAGVISSSDSILSAIEKLNGNIALDLPSSLTNGYIYVGNALNVATGVLPSGDWTMSNAGVATLASSGVSAGTYNGVGSVSVDAKGRVTSISSLTDTQETPSGTINNSNVTFTLAHTPHKPLSLLLEKDGLGLLQGTDYTISGNTITMTTAPNYAETLFAKYTY